MSAKNSHQKIACMAVSNREKFIARLAGNPEPAEPTPVLNDDAVYKSEQVFIAEINAVFAKHGVTVERFLEILDEAAY